MSDNSLEALRAGGPALDRDELLHRCRGKTHFVDGLIRMFVEMLPQTLESLRGAIRANDTAALAAKAHALKGNAANLSAKPLASAASMLDRCARGADSHASVLAMACVEQECERLLVELSAAGASMGIDKPRS